MGVVSLVFVACILIGKSVIVGYNVQIGVTFQL